MRILRYGTAASSFQKIQVSALVGLFHMVLIKVDITPICNRNIHWPGGFPFFDLLIGNVEV